MLLYVKPTVIENKQPISERMIVFIRLVGGELIQKE